MSGNGIRSKQNLPVATTINQVLMRGDVKTMQKGEMKKLPRGNHRLDEVKLVYHDRIGYILPSPTTIHLSNQAEKGSWADITDQKNVSKEIVTLDVFTLWFDHGKSPDSASYQYIVVPAVSEQELIETSRNNRGIKIIANTSDLQAVSHDKSGICQVIFHKAGEIKISDGLKVRMDSPGMAMFKMQGGKVQELTISDPSRKLSRIMVTLPGNYNIKGDHFITLPTTDRNSTMIIVDLPQDVYVGKSVTVQLN